jgi:hypothetical protein
MLWGFARSVTFCFFLLQAFAQSSTFCFFILQAFAQSVTFWLGEQLLFNNYFFLNFWINYHLIIGN